ncbi:MAG TPA: tRNA (adenosine(37)-N6)-dimethylallyltransferase MiaA [Candidatus Taylorbacteria bacterium]|nr:MAG: tRNA dimethylallyltransferase [Parcubacteria group bacterium GW2011_GWA2_47_64]KKU95730.1 MAG: tRNA dimethylallyltransferase [Parcubacteria group bacterium GW2011_GWC2_48_17]HBV01681.1 tRNA (adenosine(37)-N6)-dimethylallyltransferase MiaA [Candidatus Taylorbacteria bacterium]
MKSALKTPLENKAVYSIIRANNGIDARRVRGVLRKILVIVGPTAVGKSALAVRLAKKWSGEVISADSRQIYKGLDIGTGKITKKEMMGIPHHMLDVADQKKQFNVSEYQKQVREKLEDIFSRGRLPIIVGGTGLYIKAIVNDVVFPNVTPNKKLRARLEKKTVEQLFLMLKKLDSKRAKTIDAQNPRRLVRAIEIAKALGKVPPYQNMPRKDIQPLLIGLTLSKAKLQKKITIRLFARIRRQMIEEVRRLHKRGLPWKRMEELGLEYRYVSRYLRGFLSKKEMLEKLKSEIWQYAKRQMTWFGRDKRVVWFKQNEKRAIDATVKKFL